MSLFLLIMVLRSVLWVVVTKFLLLPSLNDICTNLQLVYIYEVAFFHPYKLKIQKFSKTKIWSTNGVMHKLNKNKVMLGFGLYTDVNGSPFFHAMLMFNEASCKGNSILSEGGAPLVKYVQGLGRALAMSLETTCNNK